MYELRWIKIVILMGVFGGFIGHFVANSIELGLVIAQGVDSKYANILQRFDGYAYFVEQRKV